MSDTTTFRLRDEDTTPQPDPEKGAMPTAGLCDIREVRISRLSQAVIMIRDVRLCSLPALSNAGGAVNQRAHEIAANARLLSASFNAYQSAAAKLGVNPIALAESVDVAGLVEALRQCWLALNSSYDVNEYPATPDCDQRLAMIAAEKALSTIPTA